MIRRIVILFCVIMLGQTVHAYFNDVAEGVRPAGMGGAFVGLADDCNTMLYNPAGLAQIKKIEFVGMYSALYTGLNFRTFQEASVGSGYNFLSIAVPFSESGTDAIGLSWVMLNDELYKEHTFMLSYGFNLIRNLSVGVSAKNYQWILESSYYTKDSDEYPDRGDLFPVLTKTGMTIDVGLFLVTSQGVKLGLDIENVLPADVGLWEEEIVPMIYRIGVSYSLPVKWIGYLKLKALDDILLTTEYSYRDTVQNIKIGVESWLWNHFLAFRAGANMNAFSLGFSFSRYWQGVPIDFQLDYAFNYPYEIQDSLGSHRMGLSVRQHMEPVVIPESKPTAEPTVTVVKIQATPIPTLVPDTTVRVIIPDQGKIEHHINPVPNDEGKVIIGYIKSGLFQFNTAQETLRMMEKVKRSIEIRTKIEILLVGFKDEIQLIKHLENNQIDLVIPSGEKLDVLLKDNYSQPICTVTKKDRDYQFLSFYVFSDRDNKKLSHLHKKKIAIIGMESTNRINAYIKRIEPTLKTNFIYYNNAPAALLALYMNQIDAIVGPDNYVETTYRNLVKRKMFDTAINKIHRTSIVVKNRRVHMRKSVMPGKKKKIIKLYKALNTIFENEDNQNFLEFFGFDKLKIVSP